MFTITSTFSILKKQTTIIGGLGMDSEPFIRRMVVFGLVQGQLLARSRGWLRGHDTIYSSLTLI